MNFEALNEEVKGKKINWVCPNRIFSETTGFTKHTTTIPDGQEFTLRGILYSFSWGSYLFQTEELSKAEQILTLFLPASWFEVDGKPGHEWVIEILEKHGFPALPDNYAKTHYVSAEEAAKYE